MHDVGDAEHRAPAMRAGEPQGDADEETDAMLKGAATQRNSGMVPLDIEAECVFFF